MPSALRRALRFAVLFAAIAAISAATGADAGGAVVAANGPAVVTVPLDANEPAPGVWVCLRANPSCARHDPWWQEALLQPPAEPTSVVQFPPLGSGFSADPRLAEAVLWLWSWPDGRTLLRAAAANGVSVRVAALPPPSARQESVARYQVQERTVEIGRDFVSAPSWLLGDVLAHELTHAAQAAAGQKLGAGQVLCTAAELPARRIEVAYLRYVHQQLGAPPADASDRLTPAGRELLQMAEGLLDSPDLPGLAAGLCAGAGV